MQTGVTNQNYVINLFGLNFLRYGQKIRLLHELQKENKNKLMAINGPITFRYVGHKQHLDLKSMMNVTFSQQRF